MRQTKPRQRAVQQRAEETKEAIVQAGIELFSARGYDGVSIKALEDASQTKRGLVAYHFGSKEALWKVVATRIFAPMPQMTGPDDQKPDTQLQKDELLRASLTEFVLYSAAHPELSRLIIQEAKTRSWRLDFLVENFVRPRVKWMERLMGEIDAHTLYIFVGAATLMFDVEAECEQLFGFNPRQEHIARAHAERLCDLLLGYRPTTAL
ncbi:MAG: TetR/AcrR family transcriptional regulator [Pseudomonadota bacterium]